MCRIGRVKYGMLGSKNVDVLGHLGGFLTGAILGHWIMPCSETQGFKLERARRIGFWSKIATLLWFVTMIACFYTLREPVDKFSGAGSSTNSVTAVDEATNGESSE